MKQWLAIFLLTLLNSAVAGFEAGIAVRDVTPSPLLPVSGGLGPSRPVSQSKGKLTVRALVLANTNARVAIVSADFLGFPAVLGNRVRTQVPDIPPSHILIGATHTHSAPDCYAFPPAVTGSRPDLDYLNSVCTKMAEAIRDASSHLQPASLRVATGEARGQIAYNYYAEQLYDPRCHVLQFLGPEKKPLATLVNYAIHPEVLGADTGILSPDLVGPLYDRIQEQGGGTGIFLNSAQGGMVTADNRTPDGRERRSWAECLRIGRLLADEALRIVQTAPLQPNPPLRCVAKTISFPVESKAFQAVLEGSPLPYSTTPDHHVQTQINLLNLGNAQILTIPGEALPNIGYFLKRKMHGEHNLLFGLTNDAFGYILTRVDWGSFKRYDYITRTCLGEMTGEILIDQALALIEQTPAPPPLTQ